MTLTANAPANVAPDRDPRDPELRLTKLLDPGSLQPLHVRDDSGVYAVRGSVDGALVTAFATDPLKMGGAMGSEGCAHIVDAIDQAVRERVPVIGLWHSGGARLAEGVEALHAVGLVFAAMVRASGRVPQISVVLGPAAGGAAYGPALTDLVIMSTGGRVFVTGPDVVRSVTGENVDMESLGGPDTHGRRSGVVHIVTDSTTRHRRGPHDGVLLAQQGSFHLDEIGAEEDLRVLLPDSPKRAYDVHPLVHGLLDADTFLELHARWAPNIVTGLGRLPAARSALSPTTRCGWAAAWIPRPRRRRLGSCGCATRSVCRWSCSSTCRAICPASVRSGTASCDGAPSCCTPSARRLSLA